MMISKQAPLLIAVLAVAACNVRTDNQGESANDIVGTEAPATEVTASNDTGAYPSPANNEISSGMPVPGTNTPEHVVVNETPGNGQ